MSKVGEIFLTIIRILEAILARCLFLAYGFIAVWRVAEARNDAHYWLLLLTICPLACESIYTIIKRKGKGLKWTTPYVLFFLFCSVPCIWLLELKLLDDRINGKPENSTIEASTTNAYISVKTLEPSITDIYIHLPDTTWTLALEQTLIFILVLAKWIAPKGDLSPDQLSQLLLVNIAAGADIIELMEAFGEDSVSKNEELVYLVLLVWTWSLLQFSVVLTATRNIPELENSSSEVIIISDKDGHVMTCQCENKNANQIYDEKNQTKLEHDDTNVKIKSNTVNQVIVLSSLSKKEIIPMSAQEETSADTEKSQENDSISTTSETITNKKPEEPSSRSSMDNVQGTKKQLETPETSNEHIKTKNDDNPSGNNSFIKTDSRATQKEAQSCSHCRSCCDCFCCYNEIWGMSMSLLFQDIPFFAVRMVLLCGYNIITHMNVFFTCKNVFVIILLVNRIRVLLAEDKKPWKAMMKEAARRQLIERETATQEPEERDMRSEFATALTSKFTSRRTWYSWRA